MNTNLSSPGTSVQTIPQLTPLSSVGNLYVVPTTPALQINTPVLPLATGTLSSPRSRVPTSNQILNTPTTRIVTTPTTGATNYPVTILPSMAGTPSSSIAVSSPTNRVMTPLTNRIATPPTDRIATPLTNRMATTTRPTSAPVGTVSSPTSRVTTPLSTGTLRTSPTTRTTAPLTRGVLPSTVIPPPVRSVGVSTPTMTQVLSPAPPSVRTSGTASPVRTGGSLASIPTSPISQMGPPLTPSQISALSTRPSSSTTVSSSIVPLSYMDNREQVNNFIRNCPVDSLCIMVLNHMNTKHHDIKRTVGDIIRANKSLSTLKDYLTQTGLLESLDADDVITVLAPTNEAFAKAVQDGYLTGKTLEDVKEILKKHVIIGKWTPDMLKYQLNNSRIKSLSDGFYIRNDSTGTYMYGDKTQAKLHDGHAGYNGYIYEIDEVIL